MTSLNDLIRRSLVFDKTVLTRKPECDLQAYSGLSTFADNVGCLLLQEVSD